MKVYVLTEGDYSDYHIEAVKLDKSEARRFLKVHPDWRLEEYDTEDVTIPDRTTYTVWANKKGIADVQEGVNYNMPEVPMGTVCFNVSRVLHKGRWTGVVVEATDVNQAKKIASDIIATAMYVREAVLAERDEE